MGIWFPRNGPSFFFFFFCNVFISHVCNYINTEVTVIMECGKLPIFHIGKPGCLSGNLNISVGSLPLFIIFFYYSLFWWSDLFTWFFFKVSVLLTVLMPNWGHSELIISRLFYLMLEEQAAYDDPTETWGRFVKGVYSSCSNPCFQKDSVFKCSLISE